MLFLLLLLLSVAMSRCCSSSPSASLAHLLQVPDQHGSTAFPMICCFRRNLNTRAQLGTDPPFRTRLIKTRRRLTQTQKLRSYFLVLTHTKSKDDTLSWIKVLLRIVTVVLIGLKLKGIIKTNRAGSSFPNCIIFRKIVP